jgi:hypothetical protein
MFAIWGLSFANSHRDSTPAVSHRQEKTDPVVNPDEEKAAETNAAV